MATPLEKARKDPDSMKARILQAARRIYGEYGFHGTTTRMIARKVGIDISTLYYHWGEKGDLYEAVILDINEDLGRKLVEVESLIHGLSLSRRMDIAIDQMTDYLFLHPEISNLVLFQYFGKTRRETNLDFKVPEFISDIARSMGLFKDKKGVPTPIKMQVLAMMNAIHNFISGENFFRPILNIGRSEYIASAKETLKFLLIPAFTEPQKPKGGKDKKRST
jgi:TetR/AcrR family transcriptional regulator, regulator of cefoperazone and chloramphenicol sensitivity